MLSVKFLDYSKLYSHYWPEVQVAMEKSLRNGKLILQEDVEEFEHNFAKFLGVKYVVGLNSGTDALLLALAAAGVGPGDEVITVSHTFIATIQVIHHLRAKPILVDVGDDGLMDYPIVKKAVTEKTKVIIPVHLAGDFVENIEDRSIDLDTFSHWAFKNGVEIIEDACQALGAEGVGYGLAQAYSFYPAKVLGTFGDAGGLATNDDDVAERVRRLRNHGGVTKDKYDTYKYGWNSRLDNVWAAVLNVKLKYLERDLARRKEIAQKYNEAFAELPMILPVNRKGRIWQDYVIMPSKLKKFHKYLTDHGVETLGYNSLPNHLHPGLGLEHFDLPKTEAHIRQSIRIPCNHFMTDKEVNYVIKTIQDFYATK